MGFESDAGLTRTMHMTENVCLIFIPLRNLQAYVLCVFPLLRNLLDSSEYLTRSFNCERFKCSV